MSKGSARCRRSDSRISMTATFAAVLAALVLLCTGCGGSVSSLLSPVRAGRTVRVVIEDNPQIRVESSVLTAKEGSDLQFTITPAQHCTVRGTDYRDYSLAPAQDGQYLVTLHDVLFDTVVSVLTEENPYTIRYEANGGRASASSGLAGPSAVVSYPASHLRVNTGQGTHLFEREGCILTGWNTAADGSGQHIGLGSRVRVGRGETLTLYAEWALCNDKSDFLYEKGANSVTITGFNGGNRSTSEAGGKQPQPHTAPEVIDTSEVIVIPSEIDGLPVTGIAQGAFQDVTCDRVVFPPTIRFVEVHAFDKCTLSELVLFDSVSEITDHAFAGCENLRTIHINACVPPVYSGSYYDTFPDKYDRLTALSNDAKIVLFSGSSTRFGYDSAYLDDAFPDYAVVNMGVFAYTNALPQLDLIRRQMKAGDTLIHSPEFDAAKRQFCTTNAFDDKFFNMIEADYDLLAELDYRDYEGVLSAFTAYQKVRRGMEAKSYAVSASDFDEDGQPVSTPSYNEYGDYIVYRPNAEDDAPIYDLPVNYTAGAFSRDSYIDPLNAVYDKFAADGIRVLFTYAPRNKSALSKESDSAALAGLDAWLRETLHAEVISPIEDSLYPGRYLFGTDNHLSTDGVSIRSERIRRDLKEVLDDAK
ncbi:MAG TPA: hypothetical protein DCF49_10260 [Lachnospiraceae bacterium]|nr:hypothetical protein [Lachnospiraceae bacterium]